MNQFNYNGKLFADGTLITGPDNRGLRYGDGLFETLKMKNGQLIYPDEHFARLWKGMNVLQFDIPKHFTPEKLDREINALVKKNRHENAARVRLNVFRGNGGLYDATNNFPNYIIQSWALPPVNAEWNSNGLIAGIYSDARKSCDILGNIKHNNYLPYVLGALKAKENKWNDAVLLNTYGRICDTTVANIFLIKNENIYTPLLSEGCVAGIMRKKIIQQLIKFDFTVAEKEIAAEELFNADEVFFTNSIYNLKWVQRIGEGVFSNAVTKKIYDKVISTID
jgi:branched-chain amino acid aminotransferase